MIIKLFYFIFFLVVLISCKSAKKQSVQANASFINETKEDIAQLELSDSVKLIHIKGNFYYNKRKQLFEKTVAMREDSAGHLVDVEYFNGFLPQDIDPLTFEQIDGFYAKDKNMAYVYRPTAGGMMISKIPEADLKTFNGFEEINGFFAKDKNHVYDGGSILPHMDPKKLKLVKDKNGEVVKLISGKYTHKMN